MKYIRYALYGAATVFLLGFVLGLVLGAVKAVVGSGVMALVFYCFGALLEDNVDNVVN